MSNHEQPTPSHPKYGVRNTVGRDKQTPQGSARTTSAVDLEEFCEKHCEKLLPIMADNVKGQGYRDMTIRTKQEEKVSYSRDLEAEDGACLRTPIAVRKFQGIRKITLKAKIVKGALEV
ncbi:hypothetical protein Tco_1420420 [Tanacetum coccineum]